MEDLLPTIVIGVGAGVVVFSYLGAWLLGRGHGRREAEREHREAPPDVRLERISHVERSLESMARSIERLTDQQRLLAVRQQRAQAKGASPESSFDPRRVQGHDTPA